MAGGRTPVQGENVRIAIPRSEIWLQGGWPLSGSYRSFRLGVSDVPHEFYTGDYDEY
jgi:hypothetical protein